MDDRVKERLAQAGIDADDGIARVLGNEALYIKLLHKFLDGESYALAVADIGNGEWAKAKDNVHTLKGLSANLSMERLHKECVVAEQALIQNTIPGNLDALEKSYRDVVDAIQSM